MFFGGGMGIFLMDAEMVLQLNTVNTMKWT